MLGNVPFLVGKAALAVTAAYALARELVPRDLLSATFVAMLCVSPTVYTGLKRGAAQLFASALGGLAALAVSAALGPGPLSLGLSVALGLGAAFLCGFARTYAVAGFTVLYVSMLGHGDLDAYGVRLASVVLGVGVAALVNLLVSASFYRGIFGRRVGIAAQAAAGPLALLAGAVEARDAARLREADLALGPVFRLLADLRDEFQDLRRELTLRKGWRGDVRATLLQERIVDRLELVCHHARDLALMLRELYRDEEGIRDVAAMGVAEVLAETRDGVVACARRLRGEGVPLPRLRPRDDPMLRHVAARLAEGDPEGLRLELVLSTLVDLENLHGATARLLELVEKLRPATPRAASPA